MCPCLTCDFKKRLKKKVKTTIAVLTEEEEEGFFSSNKAAPVFCDYRCFSETVTEVSGQATVICVWGREA